jgi:RES domain-containing protein
VSKRAGWRGPAEAAPTTTRAWAVPGTEEAERSDFWPLQPAQIDPIRSYAATDRRKREEALMVSISDSLGCSIVRGATGRKTNFLDAKDNADEREVIAWRDAPDMDAMLAHPTAVRFAQLLRTHAPLEAAPPMRTYRGRWFSLAADAKPGEFGPPPANRCKHGRYNNEGHPVLYLASSSQGVLAEFSEDQDSHEPRFLMCQALDSDLSGLRIFDASASTLANFEHCVWDYAERPDIGRVAGKEYLFSRAVAAVVRAAGFDGMLVPGVRGTPSNRYNNLVLFDAEPRWRDWPAPESAQQLRT